MGRKVDPGAGAATVSRDAKDAEGGQGGLKDGARGRRNLRFEGAIRRGRGARVSQKIELGAGLVAV